MLTARRRYFIAEGEEATALIERVQSERRAHQTRMREFLAKFNTTHCIHRSGIPIRIMVEDGQPIADGLKVDGRKHHEGKTYLELKPLLNTSAGKAIKRQMEQVGKFVASDIITEHYDCGMFVYGGNSMWVATGWIHTEKNLIAIQVPEDDENLYTPHPTFREIQKLEYIAITEE